MCVYHWALCYWGHPLLAPALGLLGVKELLSIGEAPYSDLINSSHVKQLYHKGLCCLRRPSGVIEEEEGVTEAATGKWAKSFIVVNYQPLTSQCR